jgi:hypothetical protein
MIWENKSSGSLRYYYYIQKVKNGIRYLELFSPMRAFTYRNIIQKNYSGAI